MKLLRWWKHVNMPDLPGVSFDLVPLQEASEDQAFFAQTLKAVEASDMSFELIERTDVVIRIR